MNIFIITARQLSERRLRSSLTVLGIAIGIAALVSLILLSGALKNAITGQLNSFGSNEIVIAPLNSLSAGGGPAGYGTLTTNDLNVVAQVPQVQKVIPILIKTTAVGYGQQTKYLQVNGAPPGEVESFLHRDLQAGRYMRAGDKGVTMIGSRIMNGTFSKNVALNSRIEVNGTKYRVIGIFVETGTLAQDQSVIVPIDDLRRSLGDRTAVTAARAIVAPGADMQAIEDRIKRALKRYRGRDDIGVTTPAQIIRQISSFLGVVNIIVYSIAAVSLLVAGVGIMNSLFTSVLQRTREIGTMKAVGAKNRQILLLFISESALLGIIGGVIGVLIGIGTAAGFIHLFNAFGIYRLALAVSPGLIVVSLLFSLLIGVLAGTLPAIRASRLNPVDALRYE